jgi:hypothetical protein
MWARLGVKHPGTGGTLDRRPRHSNVQHANKFPPPPRGRCAKGPETLEACALLVADCASAPPSPGRGSPSLATIALHPCMRVQAPQRIRSPKQSRFRKSRRQADSSKSPFGSTPQSKKTIPFGDPQRDGPLGWPTRTRPGKTK